MSLEPDQKRSALRAAWFERCGVHEVVDKSAVAGVSSDATKVMGL